MRWSSRHALGARGAISEQILRRCPAWMSGQLLKRALCSANEQCQSSSRLYSTLFLVTSEKHSETYRPREIRRSIRRRWDICTSLLVEPPYLRAPAISSKPSAIPCIHWRTSACLPSTSRGVVLSLLFTTAMFPPFYRTHPFHLLKSIFPSFRVELIPSTGREERTTCPARQHLFPHSLLFLFKVLT